MKCSFFFYHTEELLLKNQRERLSFLTRTEPLVGEKDVYAKLGDNVSLFCHWIFCCCFTSCQNVINWIFVLSMQRDLCIKKALKAKGITTTDPKVPVTDNFLCTGGDRDHIACTGMFPLSTHHYTTCSTNWYPIVGIFWICWTGDSGGAVFKNYESRTIQVIKNKFK